jgi:hypothetical protein
MIHQEHEERRENTIKIININKTAWATTIAKALLPSSSLLSLIY